MRASQKSYPDSVSRSPVFDRLFFRFLGDRPSVPSPTRPLRHPKRRVWRTV
ncbi:hypothetical protein CKA32_005173 [Geitlerinema sp. FC II]|nr:hypothetical protein CKA32_005173 [Geitlerinema sp. FC II]